MATDRRMRSDSIEGKRSESRQPIDAERNADDIITRVRAQYLREALSSASRYINRQVIRASNTGSKNTNDIYAELISRIANEDLSATRSDLTERMQTAMARLSDLDAQNKR